jgi:hypothetical protein
MFLVGATKQSNAHATKTLIYKKKKRRTNRIKLQFMQAAALATISNCVNQRFPTTVPQNIVEGSVRHCGIHTNFEIPRKITKKPHFLLQGTMTYLYVAAL